MQHSSDPFLDVTACLESHGLCTAWFLLVQVRPVVWNVLWPPVCVLQWGRATLCLVVVRLMSGVRRTLVGALVGALGAPSDSSLDLENTLAKSNARRRRSSRMLRRT